MPRAIDVDRVMPWAAAAIVAFAVLGHRYPAMIDLPCHEEVVAAMRHAGDTVRYPPGLMRWNLGHPNQLFYFLAYVLSLAVPVDLACKLVVAASAAGVPLGAARLADHLGVSRAAALFAAPLALGFFFYFGMVGNLLGLGMLLACLPGLDRLARFPTSETAARGLAALVVLFAAHDSVLVIGGLSVLVLSLGRPWDVPSTWWRLAPLATAGGCALAEEISTVHHNSPNLRALPVLIDLGLDQKLRNLPQALLGLHSTNPTRVAFALAVVGLALMVAQRGAALRRVMVRPITRDLFDRNRFDRYRFVALGAVLLAAYFLVPFAFAGATWLHARFLGPAVAVLGVAMAPQLPRRPWWPARWAAAGTLLLVVRLVEPELEETAQVYTYLDALLPAIAPGSAIAALDLVPTPTVGLVMTAGGAVARAVSERGGRVGASFTQGSPIPAMIVAPEHRWEDSFERLWRDSQALEPAHDLRRFRYVIALVPMAKESALKVAMEPEARLVGRSGPWLLFESLLTVAPITSGEDEPSDSETVRQRLDDERSP